MSEGERERGREEERERRGEGGERERGREGVYVHKETDIPFLVFWPQIGHLMRNRSNPFATGHEKSETSIFSSLFFALLFWKRKLG